MSSTRNREGYASAQGDQVDVDGVAVTVGVLLGRDIGVRVGSPIAADGVTRENRYVDGGYVRVGVGCKVAVLEGSNGPPEGRTRVSRKASAARMRKAPSAYGSGMGLLPSFFPVSGQNLSSSGCSRPQCGHRFLVEGSTVRRGFCLDTGSRALPVLGQNLEEAGCI